jgi:hypothetical protein
MIGSCDRKIPGIIFAPVNVMASKKYGTIRNYRDCVDTDLVTYMHVKRLQWVGDVVSMFNNRIP